MSKIEDRCVREKNKWWNLNRKNSWRKFRWILDEIFIFYLPAIEGNSSRCLHCLLLWIDQLKWIEKRLLVIIIWDTWLFIGSVFFFKRERKRFLLRVVQIDMSDWLTIVLCLSMQLLKMKWRVFFSLSVCLYFERKRKHVLFSSADYSSNFIKRLEN